MGLEPLDDAPVGTVRVLVTLTRRTVWGGRVEWYRLGDLDDRAAAELRAFVERRFPQLRARRGRGQDRLG